MNSLPVFFIIVLLNYCCITTTTKAQLHLLSFPEIYESVVPHLQTVGLQRNYTDPWGNQRILTDYVLFMAKAMNRNTWTLKTSGWNFTLSWPLHFTWQSTWPIPTWNRGNVLSPVAVFTQSHGKGFNMEGVNNYHLSGFTAIHLMIELGSLLVSRTVIEKS